MSYLHKILQYLLMDGYYVNSLSYFSRLNSMYVSLLKETALCNKD